ncbi:MAG: hypothetical protein OEW58_03800 [Gammaproteobacteria bacterium]|nr:hypothetical protein [Gammaproteobacteria bacterium]
MTSVSDDVKGYLAFAAFMFALPAMYLAPALLNALVDLSGRF